MKQHTRFRSFILCIFITLSLMVWGGVTPAAAQSGGTPPILLVVNDSSSNKFGRYLGEILRAEGLNSYTVATLGSLNASQIATYKVAILAETPLTSGQATLFSNYVTGGGYLIAMRPDAQIKGLFGLNTASGTQNNGYLKMSGTGPSQGLNTSTLQIHGTSDLYTTAAGAVVQAQLYSNATTTTAYPSVVTSSSGHGTAFTYDLARNIAYTRQGNPANGSIDVDGDNVMRTIDLFQTSGGGAPWVDLNKVPIPQADEQQRLFARLVQQAVSTSMPMPQLWYFPGTSKTMIIPTGDGHANPYSYYHDVINEVNSHNGQMTVYITGWSGLQVFDADVLGWSNLGNSFGIHPYGAPQPTDYSKLDAGYAEVQTWFGERYPSITESRTVRNHQLTWVGWTDAAELEASYGMVMDANFYAWGPWLQKADTTWAHGYITGSGQPMKFVKADGTIVPLYQQLTQIVDEQLFPIAGGFEGLNIPQALTVSQNLIDASEAGDYAAIMTQFHMDYDSWGEIADWVTGTLDYAHSKNIPIWNADRWLNFTEARHDANYTNVAWNTSTKTLSFSLNAATISGTTLSTIVPLAYNGNGLSQVKVDGANASYTIQTIKGVQVAFITVATGNHTLSATYQGPVVTPTFTPLPSDTPTATFTPTFTPTPGPTATNTPPPAVGCFVDDSVSDFAPGTNSNTFVSEVNGGQVILAPMVGENFSGSTLPSSWTANEWSLNSGGTTTIAGGSITVDGSRAGTTADYAVGTILEAQATFGAALWQHVGWVGDFDFNQNWAIFSTKDTSNQLYARTSDGTNVLIPGNWIGSAHTYRIDRTTTSQAIFWIDGTQVAALNFPYLERMRPLISDNNVNGIPVSVNWLRVTPYMASGTFTSRVFDAGTIKNWGVVNYSASGSTIAISVRTGNTASPDATWTGFTNIASSGSSIGLSGRYIQYQAALSTTDTTQTPWLESIAFVCTEGSGNQPPAVSANQASVTVNETQTASNTGTVSDPENSAVTLSASVGTVTNNGNGTWSWSYATNDGPTQSATVTITGSDGSTSGQATFSLTVNNVPPTGSFGSSSTSLLVGQNATLTFSSPADASPVDSAAGFTYSYDCTNDGSFELSGSTSTNFNCPYPTAGTITARGRVADKDGGFTDYTVDIAVVGPTPIPTAVPTNTPVPVVGCFIDDTLADFSLGSSSSTFVSPVSGGRLTLAPTTVENFDGSSIPAGWTAAPWSSGGTSDVSGGSLSLENARAGTDVDFAAGGTLEFGATFGASSWQHVGWVKDTDFNSPWAIFSTFNITNQLYTRTSDGTNTLIPGNWIGTTHAYRIDWTASQVVFSIDGTQVAVHDFSAGSRMRPVISDSSVDGVGLSVAWLTVTPYAASGTFTSRVFDAGSVKNWGAVTYSASGSSIAISARTGDIASPDESWTGFTNIASPGASLNLTGQYIQYQVTLSTADTAQTPTLDAIAFACSALNQPPVVSANQASVTVNEGQNASNTGTFSDPDNNPVMLSASVGTVIDNGNGTWSWSNATTDGPAQPVTVTITATDSNNASSQTTFSMTVNNVAPTASFAASSTSIITGQNAALTFSSPADASTVDTAAGFTYSYDCTNDGTLELTGSTSATFNCAYPLSGTFTALGRIADKDDGSTDYTVAITVVDPTATPTNTPTNTPSPTPTNTPIPPTNCFVDDTLADFSLGTNSSTFVSDVNGGQVILNPTLGQNFTGTAIPSGWASSNWASGGSVTLASGAVTVNGARAYTSTTYSINRSLEFIATFGAAQSQQIGWAADSSLSSPWAVFSTFNTTNQLYARSSSGTNTLIAGNWIGTSHRFRINRTLTQMTFYIDGTLVATHSLFSASNLRPVISDATVDSTSLTVDWLVIAPYTTPGTFTSRVFDAGASKNWGAVTYVVSGSTIALSARTGNTASPNGTWTGYTTVASPGASLGLSGRYIQYRAVMSTTDTNQTPLLDSISFVCNSGAGGQSVIQAGPVIEVPAPTATLTATPTNVIVTAPTDVPSATPTDVPATETPTATPTDEPPTPTLEPTATLAPTSTPVPPTATLAPPTATISAAPDNGVASLAVQFSSQVSGDVTGYNWSFGDGGTSADANPAYTFAAPGTYTVVLTVTSSGGSASAQTVITVS